MKKDNTFWAQVLFALTILAAMLLPSKGRAQEIPPALTLKNESDPVRRSMSVNGYTYWNVKTNKDTVAVVVLCSKRISITSYNPPGGAVAHVSIQDCTEIVEKKQERTLEWQTVSLPIPSRNGMTPAIYATETKWVTTATRWLEDVQGCYQLVPLE